jgi:hypothetical protein
MSVDPSAGAFDERKPVSAEELRELRQRLWADGGIAQGEAEELFARNASAEPSNEWTDFFVEALCGYLIENAQPRGFLSDDGAQWLIRQMQKDGRIETRAELELIIKLLEHAKHAPESLKRFALAEIEQIVLTGSGPTRGGGELTPGRIGDAEVALLRRLIFAPAGDGPAKVSKAEAEMLFRLKDATLGADNSPEWKKLFVQGVANHLMAHQSYTPTSPQDELRMDDFDDALFGNFEIDRIAAVNQAVAAEAEVTGEADWLNRLFEKDAARDELEQALVDFLAEDRTRRF